MKEPLGTDSHRTISKNSSECRLLIGHKKCFVLLCPIGEQFLLSSFGEFVHDTYCLDHGLSGSCTKEMHVVSKLSVWYKIPIWFKNTVCPKTKDAFPKIQAWAYNRYSHFHLSRLCVNIKEFLKDTTRTDNHEIVAWKREFTFFQFLSWLFPLASKLFWSWIYINISKSIKRMNFVIACLRPSQNMKLGIFTGSRAVDGKEMYKKVWCTCEVVVLPCQAIAYLTLSSPSHLYLPIIYDTLWWVKNRIFSGQIEPLLLIASQTLFWLIGSSFVSG